MLDIQLLRRDPQYVAAHCRKRGIPFDVPTYQALEEKRRRLQRRVQELQERRNAGAQGIARQMSAQQEVEPLKKAMHQVQSELKQAKSQLDDLLAELHRIHLDLPNLLDESVPVGKDEKDNQVLLSWGKKPVFDFKPKEHYDLFPRLVDLELAAELSGSRFTLLRGSIALLHRALAQMMLDVHTREHSYEEVYVPLIVKRDALINTTQLPKFAADVFHLREKEACLIPTSEVPLVNLVANRVIEEQELPIKVTAYSPCFRSEAGSYGKDVKGMLRLHQFDKVELVRITKPAESWDALEEMCREAQKILQLLELPYRVATLCAGDTGFAATKTYDIEVWLPGQDRYREISSCSNCTDFQARRMQTRWRDSQGNKELVHTLNASGLAVGRTLIAVLENYQTADNRVRIPAALSPYMSPNMTHIC